MFLLMLRQPSQEADELQEVVNLNTGWLHEWNDGWNNLFS